MSLILWLPLNRDLRNQGTKGVNITNANAVIDDSGKLGKCYSFDGTYLQFDRILPNPCSAFSIAGWVKLNSGYATNNGFHLISFQETYGRICISKDTLAVRVLLHKDSTNYLGGSSSAASTLTSGVWNHYTVTFDNGVVNVYINGQLDSTNTTPFTSITLSSSVFRVGTYASESAKGCANDVRLYDHALSVNEVKELAKGLVCHYKLDDSSIQEMNNCYSYPTFNTTAQNGGWSHWGQSGSSGSYNQNTNKTYIFNTSRTYSHWFTNGESATGDYLLYQSPAFEGGYRSLCCILKEENSLPITENIVYPTWDDNDTSSGVPLQKWTSVQHIGRGFYLCKVEGFKQKGSNDLVGMYIKPGYKVYVSEGYLENDRECCSDIFLNSTVVRDSSGLGNNGTVVSSLSISNDTSRYDKSTHYNGTSYLYITSISNEVCTVSLWAKWDVIPSGQSVIFVDSKSRLGLGLHSGGILCGSSSGKYKNFSKANLVANTWYHFVVVSPNGYSDTTRKLYINGVEQPPLTTESVWSYGVNELQLGKRSTTSDGFVGRISDFRMYATPLSADAIKELYEVGAKIDKNGNMYGYELKEG